MVNNLTIEILVELGIIGFVLFALFATSLVIRTVMFLSANKLSSPGIAALAILGYLFAEAIQYQTFSTLYIMHIWFAIGLLMAIVLGDNSKEDSNGDETKKGRAKA